MKVLVAHYTDEWRIGHEDTRIFANTDAERFKLNKIVDRNANKLKLYEIPILVFGCLVGLAYIITGIIF